MQNFHHNDFCPIRDILSRLGSKWSILVLITLKANGVMRYNDIQKSIGDISQRMLAITLHHLSSDGLIQRMVYPEVPPRVEYKLTQRGLSLIPFLQNLIDWAIVNSEAIMNDRHQIDA
jgi:DNA-binding HxlR family transcriptional regulator